jgi:GWxTD domain-containing protein
VRRLAQGGCLTLLLGASVSGQAPAERRTLLMTRDSLALVSDTAALLQLEHSWIEFARTNRDDPMVHLRLGLLALRLGELREGPHIDQAIAEFEWAAELRPEWPWAWYGIGLAETRGPNRAGGFAGGLYTMLGLDRDRLAGTAFARAIAVDPTFVHALTEFAQVTLSQRVHAPLGNALDALRKATATPLGWDPGLLLALGRLERRAGSADAALLAFQRAQLLSSAPATVWLELARTIPIAAGRGTDPESSQRLRTGRAYFEGIRNPDAGQVARYRQDIEPIATEAELAAYDSLGGGELQAFLQNFWSSRDALAMREPGSRLSEHFRRWNVAEREFRLPPFRRRFRWGIETYRSNSEEFDDRGMVWIRHGEPTLRVEWPKGRGNFRPDPLDRHLGNESWRYDRPDGRFTLHFVAHDDPNDYRLVEDPGDLDVALDLLERRSEDFPELGRLIRAGSASRDWVTADVRREARLAIALATQTDSWERHYEELLTGRALWLAAGVRNGKPVAHLVYSIDAAAVRSMQGGDSSRAVPVRVRASFFDQHGSPVATLDTLQLFTVPAGDSRLFAARAEVAVPPGLLSARFGIELGTSHGVVYPMTTLTVPDPKAESLEVSALVIGKPGRSLPWAVTPADTAWFDASGSYSPSDSLVIYAEAYGFSPTAPVTVNVAVTRQRSGLARLLGGRSRAITISEQLLPRAGSLQYRRVLSLGGLRPGDYALELVIESGGVKVERRRGFSVR